MMAMMDVASNNYK